MGRPPLFLVAGPTRRVQGGATAQRAMAALLIFGALTLGLGACGGGGDDESEPAGGGGSETAESVQTLELAADPSGRPAYDKTSLEASAGTVEIWLTNQSPEPHDVVIEGEGGVVARTDIFKGARGGIEVDLEPGTYTFYCSVDNHREAGMEGTLTVK
jgi:plastocyanin